MELLDGHEQWWKAVKPLKSLLERFEQLRESAGIHDWPMNAMRHTAPSHWLNFYQDEADFRLLDVLTVLRREDHPALINAFEVDRFPTLVIHEDGKEIDRFVGGKIIRGNLRYILTELANNNYTNQ